MATITSTAAVAAALTRLAATLAAAAMGRHSYHALAAIAGQTAVEAVTQALRDGTASADALESLLADLSGPELTGTCAALAKAVTGCRPA